VAQIRRSKIVVKIHPRRAEIFALPDGLRLSLAAEFQKLIHPEKRKGLAEREAI
jgi:hypothetical protein